jgi:hypothetical protein
LGHCRFKNVSATAGESFRSPLETTAQAIASLDAQFPWLRGAEQRARH